MNAADYMRKKLEDPGVRSVVSEMVNTETDPLRRRVENIEKILIQKGIAEMKPVEDVNVG
jgi:hypothetical protein